MPILTEHGYLGSVTVNHGGGASRLPALSQDGEPAYTPAVEGAWARELVGSDGKFRFLKTGSAQKVVPALDTILADRFTVFVLCRPENNSNYSNVVSKGSYGTTEWWGLAPSGPSANGPTLSIKHGAGAGAGAYGAQAARKPGSWMWAVAQRDGGALAVWGDAKRSGGTDASATPLYSTGALLIAAVNYRVNVAAVLIYERVLSDAEILQVQSGATAPAAVAGLAAYYKFNEAGGTVCTDYSGRGNHLTYSADFASLSEEYSPDGDLARDGVFSNASVWAVPSGMSVGGGKLVMGATSGSPFASQAARGIVAGNKYRVTFTVSRWQSGSVRVFLCGANGAQGITPARSGAGTYVEDVTVNQSGSTLNHAIRIQSYLDGADLDVGNLSIIPLTNFDGGSGLPYVSRRQRDATNWWDRLPTSKAAAQFQGSYMNTRGDVLVPDAPLLRVTGDITILGWMRCGRSTAATGNSWTVASKNGSASEFRFDLTADGKFLQLYRNGASVSVQLAKPVPTQSWAQLGVTHAVSGANANTARFYVNGLFVGSALFSPGVPAASTAAVTLGAIVANRPAAHRSMRIFARALSDQEIDHLFIHDTHPRPDPALVGEWLCDEPWNPQIRDTSGNGLHGTAGPIPTPLLASPYAALRKKRAGRQLAMPGVGWIAVPGLREALNGASVVTLTGWVKTPHAASAHTLLGLYSTSTARHVVRLHRTASGFLQGQLARSVTDTPTTTQAGTVHAGDSQWRLYGISFDCVAKSVKFYQDGLLVFAQTGLATSTGGAFDLGADTELDLGRIGIPSFPAALRDDLRLYNRELTQAEHRKLYFDIAPAEGLVVEYKFDNDTTACRDTSGRGLDGTWSGFGAINYVQQP